MPIIQIVAFRGTGGVIDPGHPYFGQEAGLVRAGHVGLQGVMPGKIIGFSPTPEAAGAAGGEQALLEKLVNEHEPQPGCLQDDTHHFLRAYELIAETDGKTTVWEIDVEVSEETLETIREWYNQKYERMYNLPNPEPPEFREGEYNCATFPTVFDLPIPAATGKLASYIAVMRIQGARLWKPNNVNP